MKKIHYTIAYGGFFSKNEDAPTFCSGGDLLSHIENVVPKEDYLLEIQLDNGSIITLNLKRKLETLRFGMLADREFFRNAVTDGSYIRWDNKIEISINEVFQLAQR